MSHPFLCLEAFVEEMAFMEFVEEKRLHSTLLDSISSKYVDDKNVLFFLF